MIDKKTIDTILRFLAYISGRVDMAAENYRVDDDRTGLEYNYLVGQKNATEHIIELITE